jgi:hypothetical protein
MATKKISANKGDVAEAFVGAAVAARYAKRIKNQTSRTLDKVTRKDIDDLLDDVLSSGSVTRNVKDLRIITKQVEDNITFKLALPQNAMDFLKIKSNRDDVSDFINSAINYVNADRRLSLQSQVFAYNGKVDSIVVDSAGVADQKGTKVDISITVNGKKTRNQISLKVTGGEQFAQVVGFGIDKFDKLFVDLLGLNISKSVKDKTEGFIEEFNISEAFSVKFQTREDVTNSEWASLLKSAAEVYYKGAASNMNAVKDTVAFKENLFNAIKFGATRNEEGVMLLKLKGGGKFVQQTFDASFKNSLIRQSFIIETSFEDNPTIKIFLIDKATNKKGDVLMQLRARIDSQSTGSGSNKKYKIMLRQLMEADKGFFQI